MSQTKTSLNVQLNPEYVAFKKEEDNINGLQEVEGEISDEECSRMKIKLVEKYGGIPSKYLTETIIESATALKEALNTAIDMRLWWNKPETEIMRGGDVMGIVFSLKAHFPGILKRGITPGGNPGFSVDEDSIKNNF